MSSTHDSRHVSATESRGVSAADVVWLGAWTGIVAGVAEAARSVWRERVAFSPTGEFTAGEVFWMTPLAATAGFLVAGLTAIAIDRALRGRGRLLRFAPPLFVGLATYSFVRALRIGISDLAAVVLALGLATLTARILAIHAPVVRRIVRLTTPWMMLALAVWAALVPVSRNFAASRALARLPEPDGRRPNVIVLIWDSVRALSLSLYGHTRDTSPQLDRFAREGAVFERAFATSSWSLPSHASILTGRLPTEMSAARRAPLDGTHRTLAEVLGANGYATATFTANRFFGSRSFGLARGFAWYDDRPPINPRVIARTWWLSRTLQSSGWLGRSTGNPLRRRADDVDRAFLRWLDRRGSRPFFAFINHFDAHDPYLAPEPFNLSFNATQPRYWLDPGSPSYAADDLAQLRDAYESCIRYLDHELGRLLAALHQRELLDNSIVIITSDHGEEFGEHGADLVFHGHSLYAPSIHVPLVLVAPGVIPAGVRRDEPVSIRDIPATVMDMVGLAAESPFPGTSLLPLASGSATAADTSRAVLATAQRTPPRGSGQGWPTRTGDVLSVVSGRWHYIVDGMGREQLFDLDSDLLERHDRARDATLAGEIARLRAALDSMAPQRRASRPRR